MPTRSKRSSIAAAHRRTIGTIVSTRFAENPSLEAWRELMRFVPEDLFYQRHRNSIRYLRKRGVDPNVLFLCACHHGMTPDAIALVEEGLVRVDTILARARRRGSRARCVCRPRRAGRVSRRRPGRNDPPPAGRDGVGDGMDLRRAARVVHSRTGQRERARGAGPRGDSARAKLPIMECAIDSNDELIVTNQSIIDSNQSIIDSNESIIDFK